MRLVVAMSYFGFGWLNRESDDQKRKNGDRSELRKKNVISFLCEWAAFLGVFQYVPVFSYCSLETIKLNLPQRRPSLCLFFFDRLASTVSRTTYRLFWNQILTWVSLSPSVDAISTRRALVRYLLKWNSFSSSVNCRVENVVRPDPLQTAPLGCWLANEP